MSSRSIRGRQLWTGYTISSASWVKTIQTVEQDITRRGFGWSDLPVLTVDWRIWLKEFLVHYVYKLHDSHLYRIVVSAVISSRHSRYCLVLRRSQVIRSFNYSPVVIAQEDTAWSFTSTGQDLIYGSIFFSQRVLQHWNNLPQSVVDAISVTSFKETSRQQEIRSMERVSAQCCTLYSIHRYRNIWL